MPPTDSLMHWLMFALLCARAAAFTARDGAAIYADRCLSCHGASGEGAPPDVPPFPKHLALPATIDFIARKMPLNAPGTCTGDCAAATAKYIIDHFTTPWPPSTHALSRLSRFQYRHAVEDVFSVASSVGPANGVPGLNGEYFAAIGDLRPALTRIDGTIDFDWTKVPPAPQIPLTDYQVRWTGSLVPSLDGIYDLCVAVDDGARLWVDGQLLIDLWQDGALRESCATRWLSAGRSTSLRLDFYQAREDAVIRLSWKPPGGKKAIIPVSALSTADTPLRVDLDNELPGDDLGSGFEVGGAVSLAHIDQYLGGAERVAAILKDRYAALGSCTPTEIGKEACAERFVRRFAPRAYHRPITNDEVKRLVTLYSSAANDSEGMSLIIEAMLVSPYFLYHLTPETGVEFYAADRLASFLWDSLPDDELLQKAASGSLQSPAGIVVEVQRMLRDPKLIRGFHDFYRQWLKVPAASTVVHFSPELAPDLDFSFEASMDHFLWRDGRWPAPLVGNQFLVNPALAPLLGTGAVQPGFTLLSINPSQRNGILTHPLFLASYASATESSPIRRGATLLSQLLCDAPPPPPDNIPPLPTGVIPGKTTRQKVEAHTAPQSCQRCHGVINSIGFGLEHYDQLGRYREMDNGGAVDATGFYVGADGRRLQFDGGPALATALAESPQAKRCFVRQLFRYANGRLENERDESDLDSLFQRFERSGGDIADLLLGIAQAPSFLAQKGTRP